MDLESGNEKPGPLGVMGEWALLKGLKNYSEAGGINSRELLWGIARDAVFYFWDIQRELMLSVLSTKNANYVGWCFYLASVIYSIPYLTYTSKYHILCDTSCCLSIQKWNKNVQCLWLNRSMYHLCKEVQSWWCSIRVLLDTAATLRFLPSPPASMLHRTCFNHRTHSPALCNTLYPPLPNLQ